MRIDKKTHPNVFSGHQYALDVVSGKEVACKYVIGACQRYLRELEETEFFYFDIEIAERYLRLVQQFEHVIGNWPTKNIVYSPWQNFIWMNIFGFISKRTNFRRFRTAHIEVARGNAKSAMASQCVLYLLALDNPQGNQIATVATKRDQAKIVLDSARAMAQKAGSYRAKTGVKVQAHTIVHQESNSVARALSSDHKGLDGLNDILAVCDELHAMNRETFDVISSGMSKRSDSLTLCITTAGFNVDSVGASQSIYAKKVCTGEIEDEQFFAIVYTIDEGDDIFEESTWRKANPGYGVSVDPITFRAKAEKAKVVAADVPNFKVKHLDMWLSEAHAYFDTAKWEVLGNPKLKLEDFKGKPCRLGVDIASKIDLASLGYIFNVDSKIYVFDRSYIPEETVNQVRSSMYENCIGSGHLIKTPGEAINQNKFKEQILADAKLFRIQDILCDPWNALSLMQDLAEKNMPVREFRMSVANLSEATKTFDAEIRKGKVFHNGSPLLKWCLGNVVCKIDSNDNVFPKKNHEKLKIDPIIAILMAYASFLQDQKKGSVYSGDRGLRII